ncbi:PIG-L deacetylase family protein [Chelativorans sp. YIM 93263]|uniref:PIG-L deacetylase family protein n=1 Tax=Chelativorans sp. YIM 93263 TaxID=2906648 RepID=UPI002378E324|nr:PIG-L family deacetylase [Chelativorans sp. YIM 93263]
MLGLAKPAASSSAEWLVERLGAPERPTIDCRDVLIVVAHPDDETIALGGQLERMEGVRLLHVTDGAPMNMGEALACGFACREDYADARRKELAAAMAFAGVDPGALLSLSVPDQAVAHHMAEVVLQVAELFREERIRLVLTHAYEGGHPDHDATALVVHAACHSLTRNGFRAPEIVEFPLYHAENGCMVVQQFAPGSERESARTVSLDGAIAEAKQRLMTAYLTQRRMLSAFGQQVERFQPAAQYDFGELPNRGGLFYRNFDWGLRPEEWPQLVSNACRDLDLPLWL